MWSESGLERTEGYTFIAKHTTAGRKDSICRRYIKSMSSTGISTPEGLLVGQRQSPDEYVCNASSPLVWDYVAKHYIARLSGGRRGAQDSAAGH
jgi:hypothetical protein